MTSIQYPDGLSAIADRYDAVFCDVWGVIHNGEHAFEPACDALAAFRATGKPVILISNAPVEAARVERLFEPLGVRADAFDRTATSGDATRNEMRKRAPGPVWKFGTNQSWVSDDPLFADLGLAFKTGDDAAFIVALGLPDPEHGDPEDYRSELAEAARKGLPMICANPDMKVRVGDRLLWCAGALAEIYEQEGGDVVYPGKPHDAIYDLARDHLAGLDFAGSGKTRILAIGDSPATDIRGARLQGLDSLYVATGLTQGDTSDFEGQTERLMAEFDTQPTYAMPALLW